MKTKLLIVSLLFCSMLSFGQGVLKTFNTQKTFNKDCNECGMYNLIYDFKCKKFYYKNENDTLNNNYKHLKNLTNLKVKYKEGIRFKIVNLNRYLYEASVSYDDIILTSEEPQILKSFFQGSDFDFKLPAAGNKAVDGDGSKGLIEFHGTSKRSAFLKELEIFKGLYDKQLEKKLNAYSICKYEAPCCEEKTENASFIDLSKSLLKLKIAFSEYKAEFADSEEAKLEDFKKILDDITDEKLLELVHFGNNVVQANYEYISPTIYPTGDRLSLNLKISPNTSDKAKKWQVASLDSDEFSVEFRVRNKWFFSFSTGPFVGFSDKFRVNKYGWQKVPDNLGMVGPDSKYKIVRSGREGMPVGIAGFANLGTKLTEGYGLGVSIGAGATVLDEARLAYFAGITQFFGQDKQFNLTLGVSFMQVKELDKGLYPDLNNTQYDATFDLEYTKKFVSGVFASVSYTIFTPSSNKKAKASSVTTPQDEDEADDTTTTQTTSETATAETDDDGKGDNSGQTKKIVKSSTVSKKPSMNSVLKTAKKIKIKN